MRRLLILFLALTALSCQNTNPEKGSGGKDADHHVQLSSTSIVDSAKSILDQSFLLKSKLLKGKISQAELTEQNKALMIHYNVLFQSLSANDTLTLFKYREMKQSKLNEQLIKISEKRKWE